MSVPPPTMSIRVNGVSHDVPEGCSVAELLVRLDLPTLRCAVEIDGRILPRSRHAEHRLAAGESLEIVSFVGGG